MPGLDWNFVFIETAAEKAGQDVAKLAGQAMGHFFHSDPNYNKRSRTLTGALLLVKGSCGRTSESAADVALTG